MNTARRQSSSGKQGFRGVIALVATAALVSFGGVAAAVDAEQSGEESPILMSAQAQSAEEVPIEEPPTAEPPVAEAPEPAADPPAQDPPSDPPAEQSNPEAPDPAEQGESGEQAGDTEVLENADQSGTEGELRSGDQSLEGELSEDDSFGVMARGPDGGTPPYLYWTAVNADGSLRAGTSFQMQRRTGGSWASEVTVTDCVGTCGSTGAVTQMPGSTW